MYLGTSNTERASVQLDNWEEGYEVRVSGKASSDIAKILRP